MAALPGLVSVNFAGSAQVKGELAALVALPKLRAVDLSHCPGVVGNLQCLAPLASLTSLALQGCAGVEGKRSWRRCVHRPFLTACLCSSPDAYSSLLFCRRHRGFQ